MKATSQVILGMLRLGRRTGYEIKQLVDVSVRFFWAASYGQIYPELKRLEDQGLIRGEDAASGGRQRHAYELTPEGERTLDEWLRSSEPPLLELRDEGLLKLFFSDGMSPDERLALLRGMRERHDDVVASLRSIEDAAREKGGGPYEVLRFGLAFHGFCSRQLAEMEAATVA
jgi:PadR family transcriptional regulator, regulatory protein AphA